MIGRKTGTALACLFLFCIGASAESPGVEYLRMELTVPRRVVVHVLRCDLTVPGVSIAVRVAADPDGDGPAETSLVDPLTLGDAPGVLAVINANAFAPLAGPASGTAYRAGLPVRIVGWAREGGIDRSTPLPGSAAFWVSASGIPGMGILAECAPAEIAYAASGFSLMLSDGVVTENAGGPLHPRSGIGIDAKGTVVWLAVADGRRPGYSEGLSVAEWAELFRSWGAYDAINLDGGGSSILAMRKGGSFVVMNAPSDFPLFPLTRRPVPVVITVGN